MKIPRPPDPLARALGDLTRAIDPSTGHPRRYQSLDALKTACRLEEVVAQCLEQTPDNPANNEHRFVCIWHDDTDPSLWVNVDKQRWGCNAGCYSSGDVIDFVKKFYLLDHKDALDWLRVWAMYHSAGKDYIRIRLRRVEGRRA